MYFSLKNGSVFRIFAVAFFAIFFINYSISFAQDVSYDRRRLLALNAVSMSNIDFTKSIYKILAQRDGNLFFSPISIEVILALTYLGAREETASQMTRGLHLPENNELIAMGFNTFLTSIKSDDDNITLEIANKIFTDNTIPLKEEFQEIAKTSFLSDVEAVDFKNNHEAARVHINQWVEEKTNNKIKDLLAQGTVTSDTNMVLVNAIYFKGLWAEKFLASMTYPEPFFLTPNKTKDVQMMHKLSDRSNFKVSNELDCKILELPYKVGLPDKRQHKGQKFSMVVFLPNKLNGLAELEAKLPSVDFNQLMNSFEQPRVQITLPKFKLEKLTDLQKVLEKLGMVNMFENNADFSGLTEKPVKVSNVVHKAFIEVDESGTKAVAATAVRNRQRITPSLFIIQEPEVFKADHPFLFVLREKTTQSLLFVGRVVYPAYT